MCSLSLLPMLRPSTGSHSSGLKIKGDGIFFESLLYNTSWAECDACQYFPATPTVAPDLKACIFDNKQVGRSSRRMLRGLLLGLFLYD